MRALSLSSLFTVRMRMNMISASVWRVRCLSHPLFFSCSGGVLLWKTGEREREKGKSFLTAPVESLDECIVCQKTGRGKNEWRYSQISRDYAEKMSLRERERKEEMKCWWNFFSSEVFLFLFLSSFMMPMEIKERERNPWPMLHQLKAPIEGH